MAKKTPRRPEPARPDDPRAPDGGQRTNRPEETAPREQHPKPRMTGRTIYDTIVDDAFPLLLKPRTGIPLVIVVLGITALFFWFRTDGLTYETSLVGLRLGGSPAETQSTNLRKCLLEARRLDKPYAIEAATYLIQLEKEIVDNQEKLREHHRIIYTLRALRPLKSNEQLFLEEIHTHADSTFEHWFGNEKEVFHDVTKKEKFHVHFDMEKDDIRTVVTGANFLLPLPLPTRHNLDQHLTVLPNEDFEGYPNVIDAICEMNILIESRTLAISPKVDGAKRYIAGNLQGEEAKLAFDQASSGVRTISARWRNIMPNETVGVYFSWPE